jgi:hypothetical protein
VWAPQARKQQQQLTGATHLLPPVTTTLLPEIGGIPADFFRCDLWGRDRKLLSEVNNADICSDIELLVSRHNRPIVPSPVKE